MGWGGHQASRPAEDTSAGDTDGRHDPWSRSHTCSEDSTDAPAETGEGPGRRPARGPLPATAYGATVRPGAQTCSQDDTRPRRVPWAARQQRALFL